MAKITTEPPNAPLLAIALLGGHVMVAAGCAASPAPAAPPSAPTEARAGTPVRSSVQGDGERVDWQRFLARTTPLPPPFAASDPPTFGSRTDRILRRVHAPRRSTFYCGCRFDADKDVDGASCGFEPGERWKNRAGRVEWEHVVPASHMLAGRPCAEDPARDRSPREWCRRHDPEFRAMEGDPHNLVPAVGQLNAERSDHPYGEVPGEPRRFGACDFEVEDDVVEPRPEVRGDIARVYLYMVATHGLSLEDDARRRMYDWSEADPPSRAEVAVWNRTNEALGIRARWTPTPALARVAR